MHERRDNWHGPLALAADWTIIVAVGAAAVVSDLHPAAHAVAVLVIGGRQRALRALMHEASHAKLTRNRALNVWLGRLFIAWPLFSGLSGYTCGHCEHHRHLWDDRLDPKLLGYLRLGLVDPRDRGDLVRRHLLRPLLLVHAPFQVLSDLLGRDEDRRETGLRAGFVGAATAVLVLTGHGWELLLLWVLPYVTVYQVLRYWSDIADHSGLRSPDPWQATRSWDASWLVRQFVAPHDANWHLAHHLYPALPYYRIRELHRSLGPVEPYGNAHHCDGFLVPRRPCRPSVVQDVVGFSGTRSCGPSRRTDPGCALSCGRAAADAVAPDSDDQAGSRV